MREGGPTVFETRDYMFTRLDKQARDFEQGATPTTLSSPSPPPPGGGEDADDGGGDDEGD
jgi:hypothetical protein